MPDITIIVISGKTVSQSLLTQITDRNIGILYYHIHYSYYLHIIIIYNLTIFMRTYIKSDGTSGSYLGEAIILRQCALVKRNLN